MTTAIYIDTEKVKAPFPVFGIICANIKEEKYSHEVELFEHPVDADNSLITDDLKIKPMFFSVSFFIADNPQNMLEQILFLGSQEFWQDLLYSYAREFEQVFLAPSGLKSSMQNSFSSQIYETLKKMLGYEVIVNTSTGELKNMVIKDLEASRSSDRRGMSFNVTLKPVYRAEREITEMTIEKNKPAKSDTETNIKTDPVENKGKLPEEQTSVLGGLTGLAK